MSDQEKPQDSIASQQWKNIAKDFLILIGIMGTVGYGLKVGMDQLKPVSPSDALTAAIDDSLVDSKTEDKDATDEQKKALIQDIIDGKVAASPVSKGFIDVLQKESEGDKNFINSVNNNEVSPLMWICYFNAMNPENLLQTDASRVRYVTYMLEQESIDFKAVDKEGFSALHWAAWSGLPQCCKILIEAGLPVDSLENNGYTPLALAAMRGNADAVKMLLSLKADKNIAMKDGRSILAIATERAQAYHSSAESWLRFAYTLIYNEERDEDYKETVELLK